MTGQEKFEQWRKENAPDWHNYPVSSMFEAWQAAKQDSAAEIAELKEVMREIIRISDRKHDAWDRAKELLKGGEGVVLTRAALANVIETQADTIEQLQAENLRLKSKAVERLSVSERMKIERDAR